MRRQRLRPAWTPSELAGIYAEPHDARRWLDHEVRVDITVDLGRGLIERHREGPWRIADLSCGNGSIAGRLSKFVALDTEDDVVILGDFAPGYAITGPLEQTLEDLEPVDLYVLSETLEHLDDPEKILRRLREKTRFLVLSTPLEAWDETNPEHYWAWDREEVERMLLESGFSTRPFVALDMRESWSPYQFGIWAVA